MLKIGSRIAKQSTRRKYLGAGAIAFGAGIGSTDPVEHSIAEFEASVMGDSNYSERILGRQLGGYGAMFGGSASFGGAVRGTYMGYDMINHGAQHANNRRRNQVSPPGSMVFGMFNSRMS
jgi:hypothetical protein